MSDSGNRGKRILVVEDEPVIAAVVKRVLTAMGLEVDTVTNGMEAQDIIPKKHYDLYLVDIRTPAMNGKELYEWMKQVLPRVAEHVIFTTGDLITGDTETFLKQSGRSFLPKPFRPDELKIIIDKALKEERDARRSSWCSGR